MKSIKTLCIALLLPFSVLSAYAVYKVGYFGIFTYHLPSPAGWQVFTDLVIALVLILVWMFRDARARGRNVWPFVVLTFAAGSIGPLVYLILAPSSESSRAE